MDRDYFLADGVWTVKHVFVILSKCFQICNTNCNDSQDCKELDLMNGL